MNIHEKCKDWSLEYSNPSLKELEGQELEILSSILHLAGDVIASYNNMPVDLLPEVREVVLESFANIFTITKDEVVKSIDNSLSMHALNTPLEKGYQEEEVFGLNLADRFRQLLTEADLEVAAEHYHTLHPDRPEEWEEDDGNGLV